jgi:hypothetical protein
MHFEVEKTVTASNIDEAKSAILAALGDDGCEIRSHANHQIVAARGSQAKIRLVGSSMMSIKELPVEATVTLTETDSGASVHIHAYDTYGIGFMVGATEQFREALDDLVSVITESIQS